MAGSIATAVQALAMRHRQWRRARNLRLGARPRRALSPLAQWCAAGAAALGLGGAAVIALHARQLGAAGLESMPGTSAAGSADALQPAVPGAVFTVPSAASATLLRQGDAAIVIASGMRAAPPVHINLCKQMPDGAQARLLPVRIGYQFADVAKLVSSAYSAGKTLTLRNIALASAESDLPQVMVKGVANADFIRPGGTALQLSWQGGAENIRMASDAGTGAFRREAWLVWKEGALRLQRSNTNICPGAGELLVHLFRKNEMASDRALVTAFPATGAPVSAWLRPGSYSVPLAARASLEDQALFQELEQHRLVRLGRSGLIELAPRDLLAWQAAPDSARAGDLQGWGPVARDAATLKLYKRLYRMADGYYVREQVRIFNNERRLLAWRLRPGPQPRWQASVAGAPLASKADLPLAAARLFAEVPAGWAPWIRVAAWPETGEGAATRISMPWLQRHKAANGSS